MNMIRYAVCVMLALSIVFNGYSQRRWSPKAKNAVIGAGAGAVIGALVSKNNRASGALIGGAIGGGAGYLYGRHREHEMYEDRVAASRRHYYNTAGRRAEGYRTEQEEMNGQNTLMSSEANAAYGPAQQNVVYTNYFQNAAYGYQRKSW